MNRRRIDFTWRPLTIFGVITALLIFSTFTLFAQDAQVIYVQGTANLKQASGAMIPVDFGTPVNGGDTVITGRDGIVQIQQGTVNTISLQPNTVFTLQKQIVDDKPKPVLTAVLGSVTFKLQRVNGEEPGIASMSTLAGVRGTDLTVFAGNDGTTLVQVTAGQVDVQSQGRTVTLGVNQAVEVKPGAPPGQIQVLHGSIDFTNWSDNLDSQMQKDPLAALTAAGKQLDSLIASLETLVPTYNDLHAKLLAARKKREDIAANQGRDAAVKFYNETVYPLEVQTSSEFLNLRYWSLSAQSLREFVLGEIYLREKIAVLGGADAAQSASFDSEYRSIMQKFEAMVTPYLGPYDI